MNLEKMTVKVRPRRNWEAIDLGFAMARQWFLPLVAIWATVALPMFVLSFIVLIKINLLWVVLLFWWLKPLYERPMLYYLSRSLFAEFVPLKQLRRQLWQINKVNFFVSMTRWRLSTERSFSMPVNLLESLTGVNRKQRLQTLGQRQNNTATWLTLICFIFELIIVLSLVMLLYFLLPKDMVNVDSWRWQVIAENWLSYLAVVFYVIAAMVIAPFYVCAGFALYLTRRTQLEGWDIELKFKQLIRRYQQQHQPHEQTKGLLENTLTQPTPQHLAPKTQQRVSQQNFTKVVVFVLVLGGVSHLPSQGLQAKVQATTKIDPEVLAQTASQPQQLAPVQQPTTLTPAQSQQTLFDVVTGNDYGSQVVNETWQPIEKPQKTAKKQSEEKSWFEQWLDDWLNSRSGDNSNLGIGVAKGFEFIFWVFLAALVIYLLSRFTGWANWLGRFKDKSSKVRKKATPTELFGLQVSKESLPDDVLTSAKNLLQQGRPRQAIALLYRASLIYYIHEYELDIANSNTEAECEQLVQASRPKAEANVFHQLTQTWLQVAYAHHLPDTVALTQLLEQWASYFNQPQFERSHVHVPQQPTAAV